MGVGYVAWDGFVEEESHFGFSSFTNQKNIFKCQWVYQTKLTFDSVVECHKDCLVVKCLSQQEWNA